MVFLRSYADRKPKAFSVELLFEANDASRLEIAAKQGPHDCCMILDLCAGRVRGFPNQRSVSSIQPLSGASSGGPE
jgi:hypothetical protein